MNQEPNGFYPIFGSNGPIGSIDSYKIEGPGVIIGRKGSVGKIVYSSNNYTPIDTTYYLKIIDPFKNDIKFWFYYLPLLKLEKLNTHSAVPGLNRDVAYFAKVNPPELKAQQKIAAILSVLDAKIELNNRINTELKAMAKTLYDYWFVQFNFPDKNGKPYKTSGGKMVYNETLKRPIPEGWKIKELGEVANITMGQSPSGKTYNEKGDGEVFFQGSTDFGWRFPIVRKFTTEPNRMAKQGDILFSVRAPVGTMNIASDNCCIGRGLASIRSKDNNDGFLFYAMQCFERVFDRRNGEGTTFGSITKGDLFSLNITNPKMEQLRSYNAIVVHYNQMIHRRSLQNEKLTQLRDWLLPMLMNGQINVK